MVATDVCVEVDGPQNENLQFLPLGEKVRGRFDTLRLANPGNLRQRFPVPIPGQRIGLSVTDAKGFVIEPLHDPEHAAIREQAEKIGKLVPAVRELPAIDVPTWVAWLRWAVEAGLARIVSGKLPTATGTVQTRFIGTSHADPIDRLAAAMEDQNAILRQLLKKAVEK